MPRSFGITTRSCKGLSEFGNVSCSSLGGKSVIELSASRHFHYHYSNITKVSEKLTKNEADYEKTCKTCCCKSSVANILILCSFTKKIL